MPVLLDPALLAFVQTKNPDEFVARVKFLVRWAQIIGTTDARVYLAPEARGFLIRNGFFPAYASVEEALDSLSLRHRYAPQDIIGPINSIFSGASTDFFCCVKDEIHGDFESVPPQPWHSHADLNAETQRTVLLAKIEQVLHNGPPKLVIASLIPANTTEFSALVELVDPDGLDGFAPGDLPKPLAANLTAISDVEGMLDQMSAVEIWEASADSSDIKFAIQLRCREVLKRLNRYVSMESVPKFHVGSDFYASLVRNQSSGNGRFASLTLETCSSALLELENFAWKPFNKANRKADNAAPLRAHLSEGNMAMRLMAWRCPGGYLEFSNVGPKWEEEISNTDPIDAV